MPIVETTLPPQPPPDVPAPPPGEQAGRSRWVMKSIFQLGGVSILLLLLVAADYGIYRKSCHHGASPRAEALNNMRQIGLSLFEFDSEYGQFPDKATASDVKTSTATTLTLGDRSSNQLFRQLLAYGLKSEKPFWAKTSFSGSKPDDVFGTDATALQPGECSFAYIAGLSSSGPPDTPLVMAPMIPGRALFDPKPYDGKAIVLFLDNSAKALPIDKSGHVMIGGMDIFDPRQPFWKGKAPDIKWPE